MESAHTARLGGRHWFSADAGLQLFMYERITDIHTLECIRRLIFHINSFFTAYKVFPRAASKKTAESCRITARRNIRISKEANPEEIFTQDFVKWQATCFRDKAEKVSANFTWQLNVVKNGFTNFVN